MDLLWQLLADDATFDLSGGWFYFATRPASQRGEAPTMTHRAPPSTLRVLRIDLAAAPDTWATFAAGHVGEPLLLCCHYRFEDGRSKVTAMRGQLLDPSHGVFGAAAVVPPALTTDT